jgi:ribosome maturation factor RimP
MQQTETIKEKISSFINNFIANDKDHFLVEVKILPTNKLQVFVDAEKGIIISKCVEISRALQKVLEEEKWLGDNYELEVSSPGMESPLKVLKQYYRRIGREVEVLLTTGVRYEGVLRKVNEQEIEIETTIKISKKESVLEKKNIPFVEIKHTKLILNF